MTDLIKPMAEFSVEGPLKSISFDIGSYNVVISESIVVQWIVMLVLGIVFFILGRNLKVRSTSRRQMAAEYLVNFFNNMVRDTMGEKYRKYTPYIGGLFCFSILSSLMGLFGFRCPTSDLSVIAAWGITTFVLTLRNKLKTGGIKGYLKGFIEPMPFMLPFNIIGDIANPVSTDTASLCKYPCRLCNRRTYLLCFRTGRKRPCIYRRTRRMLAVL